MVTPVIVFQLFIYMAIDEVLDAVKVPPLIVFSESKIWTLTMAESEVPMIKPPTELYEPTMLIIVRELTEPVTVIPAIVL